MECVHSYMRRVSAYAAPVPGGSLAVVAQYEIHFFSGKALDRASASSRAQMDDHFAVLAVFAMEGMYRSCMWGSLLPGVPDVTMVVRYADALQCEEHKVTPHTQEVLHALLSLRESNWAA
jgi:hypothetical protein